MHKDVHYYRNTAMYAIVQTDTDGKWFLATTILFATEMEAHQQLVNLFSIHYNPYKVAVVAVSGIPEE